MIPPSFIYGGESALPTTTDSQSPDEFSAATSYEGDAFSSYISQALNSPLPKFADAYQTPALPQPDSDPSTNPPSDDYDPNAFHWSAPNADKTADQTDSWDNHSPKVKDRKRDDTIGVTTSNNLSALMSGQVVPTARPQDSVAIPLTGKTGGASGDGDSLTALDAKATASSIAGNDSSPRVAAQTAEATGKALPAGAAEQAAGVKPSDATPVAAKDSPQATPASPVAPPNAADTTKATTQAAILQTVANIGAEANPAVVGTGTSAALDTQIMKSTGQQNETAGRAVQKLPRTSSNGSLSSDSGASSAGQLATTGSGRKTEWTGVPGMADLTVQSATGELHDTPTLVAGSAADSSASQVERVSHLISQEAMVIRQSGAATLAVSLKLDHQTELFVQLTNHNGQIQASLRCERGSLAGLDGHWDQLQESLARQNVQLLPQENQASSHGQSGSYSDAAGSGQPGQSQNQRQQPGNLRAESSLPDQPANSTASPKTKNKNSVRKGWESWA
jgi:hypothetical protein